MKSTDYFFRLIKTATILLPGSIAVLIMYHALSIAIDDSYIGIFYVINLIIFAYLSGQANNYISNYLFKWLNRYYITYQRANNNKIVAIDELNKKYGLVKDNKNALMEYDWVRVKIFKQVPEIVDEIDCSIAISKLIRNISTISIIVSFYLLIFEHRELTIIALMVALLSIFAYFKKIQEIFDLGFKYLKGNEDTSVEEAINDDRPIKSLPSKFKNSAKHLTTNIKSKTIYWEISPKFHWRSLFCLPNRELICCLDGRGWLYINNKRESLKRIWLSPNAIINVPAGCQLQVHNTDDGFLSLISVLPE